MYKTLVLSGGGVRGASTLGALHGLRQAGLLNDIVRYIGVSIGSIICTFLLMGMNEDEIYEVIRPFRMRTIMKASILNFHRRMGLDIGMGLVTFIRNRFILLGFSPKITFKQLYLITGKDLVTMAVNIDKGTTHYFSRVTEPDCQVVDAIRMSCGIPFWFTLWKYKNENYVDGAVKNNFPYRYASETQEDGAKVLGIMLANAKLQTPVSDIIEYATRLTNIATDERDEQVIDKYGLNDIIYIPSQTHLDILSVTEKNIVDLYDRGKQCVAEFIKSSQTS